MDCVGRGRSGVDGGAGGIADERFSGRKSQGGAV